MTSIWRITASARPTPPALAVCLAMASTMNDLNAASPWPHSRKVIAEELGHLPKDVLRKVVCENVIRLYDLKIDGINN